ncbi:MAG: diadenylate cyclase [Desulfobacterales bacterium]|nr:diadenylate cyclase [Desulfobacterales bacterium]
MNFEDLCGQKTHCETKVLEQTIQLAVEIAREGREGRKIGTLFVVSDEISVLKRSRNLILDPLYGHPDESKHICDPNVRETIKELAQLDGAFIVGGNGVVISASRYINASTDNIELPLGLGSRHVAAASITHDTRSVAVVVSESSVVRIFDDGDLITEIIPEIWLFSKESIKLKKPYRETTLADLRIVTAKSKE